ncbi:MAG TPA: hypothetical protein VH186_21670 [Chloroflexia bacterium]|nr:hypothetical protein [Chloroflexia bacterium]
MIEQETSATQPSQPLAEKEARAWYRRVPVEFGLALLVTLFFARTLAAGMFDKIPNDGSDIYENLWNYWQWKHNLFERHVNPYFTDYVYYPSGIGLYLHSFQPLVSLQAVFLQLVFGQLLGVNLVILLALTLSTWGAYRLFLYISQHVITAWAGALIFVWCNPWQWDYMQSGQINLLSVQWVPLYVWCLLKAFDSAVGRKQWLFTGLALACLLACSLTEWYYTLQLVILTVIATLFYMVVRAKSWQACGLIFGKAAAIGLVWLGLVSPLLVNMLGQANNRLWYVPSQSQTIIRSVDLLGFIIPNAHNLLYGGLVKAAFPVGLYSGYNPSGVDGSFNPGYLPLGLALLAIIAGIRFKKIRFGLWLWVAVVFAILALGPVLHFNGQTLDWFKLPYWYLYNVPGLNISRDPSNFSVTYILAIAALASLGTRWLCEWIARKWQSPLPLLRRQLKPVTLFSAAVLVIIALEFAPLQIAMGIDPVPDFYRTTLANDKAEYAILEVPSYVQDGGLEHTRMYYQTIHHKKLLGGQLARDHKRLSPTDFLSHSPFFPEALLNDTAIPPTTSDFLPRPAFPAMSPALFGYYNIRYIVVYPQAIDPSEKDNVTSFLQRALGPNPTPVYQDNIITAYKVPPPPASYPPVLTDVGQGWFKPDTKDGQTWRWGQFGQSAEIYLENLTDKPEKVQIEFNAFSYAVPRNLRLTLNYESDVANYKLPASMPGQPFNRQKFKLELELKPGNNILTMFTFEQPVIPATYTKGQDSDPRKLCYGISNFTATPVK